MRLVTEVVGDVGTIHVDGDLDTLGAPELLEVVEELLADGSRSLVIDCTALDFIGSAGLQVLVEAHERADGRGGTVTLRQPSAFLRRMLQVTGLDSILTITALPEQSVNRPTTSQTAAGGSRNQTVLPSSGSDVTPQSSDSASTI